ncbi:MAG: TrmB family transcriptional regulator [Nocardioidaceae bacterium]
MWNDLVEIGLEPKEARFYLAVLSMDRPTVSQVAETIEINRTNAYDIMKRLVHRGLLSMTESVPPGGRGRAELQATDPQHFLDEWHQRKQMLDSLVPQLRAMHTKTGTQPRARYLEGNAGIRNALFQTLDWPSPLRGILSMRDLLTVPGEAAMNEYIASRKQRNLWLHVIRSPEKDFEHGWPTSETDLRRTRYAPKGYIFSMTMIIGEDAVAMVSSPDENFALMIESAEYAQMQSNLFEVLWDASHSQPSAPP